MPALASRAKKSVPTAAMPSVMENCWVVVSMPDAAPVRCEGTLCSTPWTMRGMTRPLPMPIMASTGESSSELAERPETVTTTARPITPISAVAGADRDDVPAVFGVQAAALERGEGEGHAEGGEGEPRPHGRVAQSLLQEEREGEQHAAEEAEEAQVHQQPAVEGPVLEEAQGEQRVAAAGTEATLPPQEGGNQGGAGSEGDPGPQRPVLGLPEDERGGDGAHAGREEHDAERVEAVGLVGAGLGDEPAGEDDGGDADGDVDQEDRPPAPAQDVEVEEDAAEDLAGDRAEADRHAEEREHPRPLLGREVGGQEGEDLGDHGGGAEALGQAGGHQHHAVGRDAGDQGGDGEDAEPDGEHPAAPDQVTQAGTGDEAGGIAERVSGDDHLQDGGGRVEIVLDAGGGDVDHEDVEERHERGRQDDREGLPAPGVVARAAAELAWALGWRLGATG